MFVSTHATAPNSLRLISFIRTLSRSKEWSRAQILKNLCSESVTAWFSTEYIVKIDDKLHQKPEFLSLRLPQTWSLAETEATGWKYSFDPLKLWVTATSHAPTSKKFKKPLLLPVTWPSFLTELRWQILLETSTHMNLVHDIKPFQFGFSPAAFSQTNMLAHGDAVHRMWHFLLPSPETLRLSNPDLQIPQDDRYDTLKKGIWPSGWSFDFTIILIA